MKYGSQGKRMKIFMSLISLGIAMYILIFVEEKVEKVEQFKIQEEETHDELYAILK